jgi:hypothetical protein
VQYLVQKEARRVWQGLRANRADSVTLLEDMQSIRLMVKAYELDPAGTHDLSQIVQEEEKDLDESKERLISTATAMISTAYDVGKYEGREMKALFCTMFDMIDEDMTTRLKAEAG